MCGRGPKEATDCYLIDFGLARRFRDSEGAIRTARSTVVFVAACRYASIAAHAGRELGPVDDLWSWLFTLVELADGSLPWRKLKDRDAVHQAKLSMVNANLLSNFPRYMLTMYDYLNTLAYDSEVCYEVFRSPLQTALMSLNDKPVNLLGVPDSGGQTVTPLNTRKRPPPRTMRNPIRRQLSRRGETRAGPLATTKHGDGRCSGAR